MFNFDFSNVNINRAPSKKGVYLVKINSMECYESQTGNARIRIKGSVDEGGQKGAAINDGINLPKSSDDKVLGIWLRFFSSLGMSPAEVRETFAKDFKTMEEAAEAIAEVCTGLIGYCYYAPAVDDNSWPTRKWVTADQYTAASDARGTTNSAGDALNSFINIDG